MDLREKYSEDDVVRDCSFVLVYDIVKRFRRERQVLLILVRIIVFLGLRGGQVNSAFSEQEVDNVSVVGFRDVGFEVVYDFQGFGKGFEVVFVSVLDSYFFQFISFIGFYFFYLQQRSVIDTGKEVFVVGFLSQVGQVQLGEGYKVLVQFDEFEVLVKELFVVYIYAVKGYRFGDFRSYVGSVLSLFRSAYLVILEGFGLFGFQFSLEFS